MSLYDIRPKYRNGKKIQYKKSYSNLSEGSRRRYRRLVDNRPLTDRRKSPIDRMAPKEARQHKRSIFQGFRQPKLKRSNVPKPTVGGRKAYTKDQLQRLAAKGKVPKGVLYGYDQFFLPNAGEKYERVYVEKDEDVEEGDEDQDIDESNIRLFNREQYFSLEEALDEEGTSEPYYYTGEGGKIEKASFLQRVFYFTTEDQPPVPLYKN